jgi:anti-sigma regulatory factor (Ser/Thr protein kinase)
MTGDGFAVTHSSDDGRAVVALEGRLDAGSRAPLWAAFEHVLAEQPTAVVFDVESVTYADGEASDWFLEMADQAARWPGVPWVLAVSDTAPMAALVRRNGVTSLRRFDTVAHAMHGVEPVLPRAEARLSLPDGPESAGAARRFAAEACGRWGLPEYVWAVSLLVSELATNAYLHAASPAELICTYADGRVRVAVRDPVGELPTRTPLAPDQEHGRGLFLVHRLSDACGVVPTVDGGKVAWSLLPAPDGKGPCDPPEPDCVVA